MFLISPLISPARTCRYRRFARPLAGTTARLAEKRVSVPGRRGRCRAPPPHRPERARLTHSVPRLAGSLKGAAPLIRRSSVSPARLSAVVTCTRSRNSSFPPALPSSGSVHPTPPFPRTGPGGPRFPAVTSTMKALRLPAPHPFGLLIRQPVPRRACSFAPGPPQAGAGPDPWGWPRSVFRPSCVDSAGASQVPRRAFPRLCGRSQTPAGPSRLARGGASGAAPAVCKTRAPTLTISRLDSVASPPAVYASRRALPRAMQHSLPAGGLRLCRAGVEPAGSRCKVSTHRVLLARAWPWRKHTSFWETCTPYLLPVSLAHVAVGRWLPSAPRADPDVRASASGSSLGSGGAPRGTVPARPAGPRGIRFSARPVRCPRDLPLGPVLRSSDSAAASQPPCSPLSSLL